MTATVVDAGVVCLLIHRGGDVPAQLKWRGQRAQWRATCTVEGNMHSGRRRPVPCARRLCERGRCGRHTTDARPQRVRAGRSAAPSLYCRAAPRLPKATAGGCGSVVAASGAVRATGGDSATVMDRASCVPSRLDCRSLDVGYLSPQTTGTK